MKKKNNKMSEFFSRSTTFMFISWRNLWRHKKRTMVVITSISIGIFALTALIGIINGFNKQMVDNTIKTSLGHISIQKKGFKDNMKLENNFKPDSKIFKILKNNKDVVASAPRIKAQGMVRSSEASRGVLIVGIDPEMEKKVTNIYNYTLKENGSKFLTSKDDKSILISKSLADKLELEIGDNIVVMLQDKEKEIVGMGFSIKGIFMTPVEAFDKFFVFVGINRLQEITGLGDSISEISVLTTNKKIANKVKTEIRGKITSKELDILSWTDLAPNLVSAVRLMEQMMMICFIIFFITVVFSVANTLIMAILERFHEIGVMKSIGTRPSWIFFMVMFEAANLGVVGLLFGTGLAVIIVLIFSFVGIDFSIFSESMRLWGSGAIIYPVITVENIVTTVIMLFVTVFIAAIYPAVKAAKIKPLEALHYV